MSSATPVAAGDKTASTPNKRAARELAAPSESAETNDLLAAYQATEDTRYRDILVERYLQLVHALARKMRARLTPNVEVGDLVSAGVMGLMDAIGGFDESKGVKFETYCTIRIRGSMLDELRERDWVPRLVRRRANKIDATRRLLAAELRREATDEEVAASMQLPLQRFQAMEKEVSRPTLIFSLDIICFEDGDSRGISKLETLADPRGKDPGDHVAMSDVMKAVLQFCDRREQLIMLLYYHRGFTMKRIGSVFGMSESRVCQIHTRIMKRLRRRIQAGQLGV